MLTIYFICLYNWKINKELKHNNIYIFSFYPTSLKQIHSRSFHHHLLLPTHIFFFSSLFVSIKISISLCVCSRTRAFSFEVIIFSLSLFLFELNCKTVISCILSFTLLFIYFFILFFCSSWLVLMMTIVI